MNINFEYYKIFYVIAKNKNITKAANELNISQPAISRMLKTMEDQMNTKLFIRQSKGVFLTQEGKELYRLIGENISGIIKAENDFTKIIKDKTLKIATDKSYLNYLINNKKIDSLLKNNTNISFINTNNFDLLNHQLVNNLIDFAIISEPINYQFSNELNFRKIDELHLILVSKFKDDNVDSKPIVLQANNSKLRQLTEYYIKRINDKSLDIITVDDYDNIYSLIYNGYCNGILIKEFILDNLENKSLYEIPSSLNIPSINMGILYNTNNELKIKNLFSDLSNSNLN